MSNACVDVRLPPLDESVYIVNILNAEDILLLLMIYLLPQSRKELASRMIVLCSMLYTVQYVRCHRIPYTSKFSKKRRLNTIGRISLV